MPLPGRFLPVEDLNDTIRIFATGATRDSDKDKLDYEGFIDPLVLQRYALYMHCNREQKDGSLRDSDNWQKGIPKTEYAKSLLRHVIDFWIAHRRNGSRDWIEELLCAILFNTMGYLHELQRNDEYNL